MTVDCQAVPGPGGSSRRRQLGHHGDGDVSCTTTIDSCRVDQRRDLRLDVAQCRGDQFIESFIIGLFIFTMMPAIFTINITNTTITH